MLLAAGKSRALSGTPQLGLSGLKTSGFGIACGSAAILLLRLSRHELDQINERRVEGIRLFVHHPMPGIGNGARKEFWVMLAQHFETCFDRRPGDLILGAPNGA